MIEAHSPTEIAVTEFRLLLGYTVACLFDLGANIQICEANLGPKTTIHFAYKVGIAKLTPAELDKLGESALKCRDDFKKLLAEKNWALTDTAIATTFEETSVSVGLLKLTAERRQQLIQQYGDQASTIAPDDNEAIKQRDWTQYLWDKGLISFEQLKAVGATDQISEG